MSLTNHEVFVLRFLFAYKDNIICERFANNAEEKARKKTSAGLLTFDVKINSFYFCFK